MVLLGFYPGQCNDAGVAPRSANWMLFVGVSTRDRE
jgi:hypothetical protein